MLFLQFTLDFRSFFVDVDVFFRSILDSSSSSVAWCTESGNSPVKLLSEKKLRKHFNNFLIWSRSHQIFIFLVFQFMLLSLRVCSIWKKCVYCTTAKLISKKTEKFFVYEEKKFVRIDSWIQINNNNKWNLPNHHLSFDSDFQTYILSFAAVTTTWARAWTSRRRKIIFRRRWNRLLKAFQFSAETCRRCRIYPGRRRKDGFVLNLGSFLVWVWGRWNEAKERGQAHVLGIFRQQL